MTIDLQTDGRAVRDGISAIRDVAQSMLDSEVPTKRQRSNLVKKAESLIALQKSVVDKIPDLVPADCTKYALTRLNAANNYVCAVLCAKIIANNHSLFLRIHLHGTLSHHFLRVIGSSY